MPALEARGPFPGEHHFLTKVRGFVMPRNLAESSAHSDPKTAEGKKKRVLSWDGFCTDRTSNDVSVQHSCTRGVAGHLLI